MASAFHPLALHAANPGPMTGHGNWTYLIMGGGSAALIDAGVGRPEHLAAIAGTLAASGSTLDTLIVTHGHNDHVNGTPHLQAAYPGLSCLKYPWPEEDRKLPIMWERLADQQHVSAGATTLAVVHTPGHAPDHCALWHEASRTLFTGDLVIPGGSVVIQIARGGDMQAYLASLERLLALQPARLLPAHGPPVENPQRVLTAAIAHRLEREEQVLAALAAGHSSIAGIAESIYHGLQSALMPLARENVRAHLEKLQREGRVPGAPTDSAHD
ncbi:MAG: MBL fold metallo-hydrolase [Vicinamibacterales bacterium]